MKKNAEDKDRNRDKVIVSVFKKIKEMRRYRLVPMSECPVNENT